MPLMFSLSLTASISSSATERTENREAGLNRRVEIKTHWKGIQIKRHVLFLPVLRTWSLPGFYNFCQRDPEHSSHCQACKVTEAPLHFCNNEERDKSFSWAFTLHTPGLHYGTQVEEFGLYTVCYGAQTMDKSLEKRHKLSRTCLESNRRICYCALILVL